MTAHSLDDNARKFILERLDAEFIAAHATASYVLTVDWLETNEDSEKKLAYKTFDTGDIQILLITKVTKNANRSTEKIKIGHSEYERLLAKSRIHLEKKRYEIRYMQNDVPFDIKYDEFADSQLRMLEVDATTAQARELFAPSDFPARLTEVTGDLNYYGYRVARVI